MTILLTPLAITAQQPGAFAALDFETLDNNYQPDGRNPP